MYTKEIIIKNEVFDYYENLIRSKKIKTKNISMDGKSKKRFGDLLC